MFMSIRPGLAIASGMVALSLAAGFATAAAQDAPPADAEARFEVASIRKADLAPFVGAGKVPPIGVRTLPNGLNATLATLRMLIMSAYQLKDYQLVGGPNWLDSD